MLINSSLEILRGGTNIRGLAASTLIFINDATPQIRRELIFEFEKLSNCDEIFEVEGEVDMGVDIG